MGFTSSWNTLHDSKGVALFCSATPQFVQQSLLTLICHLLRCALISYIVERGMGSKKVGLLDRDRLLINNLANTFILPTLITFNSSFFHLVSPQPNMRHLLYQLSLGGIKLPDVRCICLSNEFNLAAIVQLP